MIRALWLLAAVLGCGLSAPGMMGALGEIYRRAAMDMPSDSLGRARSARASAIAAQLSPWMTETWQARVRAAGQLWDLPTALAHNRQTLHWAPADSQLWMNHARLLIYAGVKDQQLKVALQRTQSLAPESPHIHLSKALLGIQVWRHVPPYFHEDTLRSVRYLLRRDSNSLYRGLVNGRLEFLACSLLDPELKLQPWCESVQRTRETCDRLSTEPAVLEHCRNLGMRRE